jgi:hypothetical protein
MGKNNINHLNLDKEKIDNPRHKVEVIKPYKGRRNIRQCNWIIRRYQHKYIIIEDGQKRINIPVLMDVLVGHLKPAVNNKYVHHCKYEEIDFINGIIDVIDNCGYWARYKGKISGPYLNKRHNQYCSWGVYNYLYQIIRKHYFNDNKYGKLKYQSMDTTFVKNLYGCEIYGMSKKNKNKNGINVSFKADANGFPISVAIASANSNDVKVALQQETSLFADCNSKNVQKNNKFKQILMADAMYYTKEFRDHMESKGYTVITDTIKGMLRIHNY